MKTKGAVLTGDLLVTRIAPITYCRRHHCEQLSLGIGDEGCSTRLWGFLCLKCLHEQVEKSDSGQVTLVKNVQVREDSNA